MRPSEPDPSREAAPAVARGGPFGARFRRALRAFDVDDAGVTAIEYALIASLVAVAILAGVGALGAQLEAMYLRVCNAVVGAIGGGSC